MLRIFIYMCGIVIFSCSSSAVRQSDKFEFPLNADTLFLSNDTIVVAELVDDDQGAIIAWGVANKYMNIGKDTLPYSRFGFSQISKTENFLLIEDGCGTACNYVYITQFAPHQNGKTFMYPILIDLERKLIVYQGGSNDKLAIAENLTTEETIEIKEEFDKTKRPYSLAIDTAYLDNNQLIMEWNQTANKVVSDTFDLSSVLK